MTVLIAQLEALTRRSHGRADSLRVSSPDETGNEEAFDRADWMRRIAALDLPDQIGLMRRDR